MTTTTTTTKMLAGLPHSSGASNQVRAPSWLNALNFSWKKNTSHPSLCPSLARASSIYADSQFRFSPSLPVLALPPSFPLSPPSSSLVPETHTISKSFIETRGLVLSCVSLSPSSVVASYHRNSLPRRLFGPFSPRACSRVSFHGRNF